MVQPCCDEGDGIIVERAQCALATQEMRPVAGFGDGQGFFVGHVQLAATTLTGSEKL